jgi:RNA 2',3'-cyclic 3'-phosphodiesterase
LFAAVVPPPPALDHLDGALDRLRDRAGAPRWVGRDTQHVTLAFFGEVPAARVPSLTDALSDALSSVEVHLRLAGAGTFPEKGDPRVLWVGVDGDVEELAGLARAAAAAGRSAGIDVDRRSYRPHVTIGRWAHAARGDRRLAAALANYAGPHFTAGEVVLMRSHHGAAPRYEAVASWRGASGGAVGTHRPTPR